MRRARAVGAARDQDHRRRQQRHQLPAGQERQRVARTQQRAEHEHEHAGQRGDRAAAPVDVPRPYQVALAQAEANLQKDEAQLNNAKAQYDRNKVLYEQGVIAKQDLDTLEASFGTYEGTIASDKAAIDNAKLNLTYCQIISPVNGRVGLRQVDPGNYVTAAGGTAMLVITQLHPIAVIFTLPEDQLQEVAQRMRSGPAGGRCLQPR